MPTGAIVHAVIADYLAHDCLLREFLFDFSPMEFPLEFSMQLKVGKNFLQLLEWKKRENFPSRLLDGAGADF
jgi:hypothetical protein